MKDKDKKKITANIVEVCEKLNAGEIAEDDNSYKKASEALANLFSMSDGRAELAELIKVYNEDHWNKHDITPLIFEKKTFKYGERPLFKTHKKGIVAYRTARNSLVPLSQNYEVEFEMTFDNLGVHVGCQKMDLKTGRLSSFATLIKEAQEAIERKRIEMVWETLAQTYNATSNKDNYIKTITVNKTALDSAINQVRRKVGGRQTLMGDYMLMTEIEEFPEFKGLEEVYKEIRDFGVLGTYRACKVVYLPEITDPVSKKSIVPTDKIMVLGQKIGYSATLGEATVDQQSVFNDQSWEYRYDKEFGNVVTRPEGMAVIHIVREQA